MRRITSFYYLRYPDGNVEDPTCAASEVYVEVGGEEATAEQFEETFSLHVYTLGYLDRETRATGTSVVRAGLVVEHFDDRTIERALTTVIDRLEQVGVKVGL
jgi:hypothetical protein